MNASQLGQFLVSARVVRNFLLAYGLVEYAKIPNTSRNVGRGKTVSHPLEWPNDCCSSLPG
jgi:hypothetical protein